MKYFAAGLVMMIVSQVALPQSAANLGPQDVKHMAMAMPDGKGRVRMAADNIDKYWAASVVHLKGSVTLEIWASKGSQEATVLRADEVDYNLKTAQISPRGNVQLRVEETK
jgi:lipopolysaccharide assembly outer membrane protein LptD (OstA)